MGEAVQEVNAMARGRNWIVACFSWGNKRHREPSVGRCHWRRGLPWCVEGGGAGAHGAMPPLLAGAASGVRVPTTREGRDAAPCLDWK
jgi:hypothetical protein